MSRNVTIREFDDHQLSDIAEYGAVNGISFDAALHAVVEAGLNALAVPQAAAQSPVTSGLSDEDVAKIAQHAAQNQADALAGLALEVQSQGGDGSAFADNSQSHAE